MESISAVSNTSIPFSHIIRASYSGGRITVPVNSTAGLYARFKHITGIPSFSGGGSIPFSRLRQLDTLIEQISRIKGNDIAVNLETKESGALDNMIEKFSSELRSRLNSAPVNYYQGIYEPGSLLNLTA